ncbi:MAG: hypothetical protein Q9219_003260 [cf. Caloplaca sp. 3 TL-2023]
MASMSLQPTPLTRSPFLELPLEIRQQIYGLLLPHSDVPLRDGSWASTIGTPNESMGLLRVNRKIADEAQEYLYASIAVTVVTARNLRTPHIREGEGRQWPGDVHVYPKLTNNLLRYVKHCQLSLGQTPGSSLTIDRVLDATRQILEMSSLQTLKISFSCWCVKTSSGFFDPVELWENIVYTLEPLHRLRLKGRVTFVMRERWHPLYEARKKFAATWPAKEMNFGQLNDKQLRDLLAYERARIVNEPQLRDFDDIDLLTQGGSAAANTQCQEPACLAFAESLAEIKGVLEGKLSLDTVPFWKYKYPGTKLYWSGMDSQEKKDYILGQLNKSLV